MQDVHDPTHAVFRALADPTRRAIIDLLAGSDGLPVGDIAARFSMTRPAVAKHINQLRESGLIRVEKSGRERVNHLQAAQLKSAQDWLARFDRYWNDKLAALKSAVEDPGI